MAWADLQTASYRGVAFDCVTINDAAQRSVAQHAYPYRDGADVEDLGRTARVMRVRAIFFGDDYLDRLNAFTEALDQPDSGELIHPVFGSIPDTQVLDFDVAHDAEGVDQANVTVTFVESVSGVSFFAAGTETQDADTIESTADETLDGATDVLADEVGDITGLGEAEGFGEAEELTLSDINFAALGHAVSNARIGDVRALMGGVTALLKSIPGMPAVALAGFDAALNPRAWAADLTALTGGLLDVHLGLSVLSDARSLMEGFRRIASLFMPAVVVAATPAGAASVGMLFPLTLTPAARQKRADAQVAALHAQCELSTTLAAAARRVLSAEAATPMLTPAEIEETANAARTSIEYAIGAWRANYSAEKARAVLDGLRDTARQVQVTAQRLIERQPPLIAYTLTAPANMRLLAHRLYGDHTRATELMRLNNYGRAPMLDAGATLKVYAR